MKKSLFIFIIAILYSISAFTQSDDPVLFTVEGKPVHVSEFLYIYQKNNGKKADFSKSSLEEYLDLYKKFKLKVMKAREMKLDTIDELIRELDGYRKQLSKSYLVDKEVNEKLVKEVFERRKKDISVSHILISSDDKTDIEKHTLSKAKIFYVYNQLEKGVDFAKLAEEHSEDKSSSNNGGKLGFVTSMLPNGFYEFENQIYSLDVGEYSKPFESDYGFHIVKVEATRQSRGEMEAAHIMIRKQSKDMNLGQSKMLVDSLYDRLLKGDNFENMAREFSMDKKSNKKGGYLGVFGINKYESSFENAAFQLKNDGDISKVISTSIGWHIIKRISKVNLDDFDQSKRAIEAQISKDKRVETAKEVLVERIKKDANFRDDTTQLSIFTSKLDPQFFTYYWKVPDSLDNHLFQLGEKSYNLKDFGNYCKKHQRERSKYGKNANLRLVVNNLYEAYVAESCMKYEESILDQKYPDFKSLMREYDEGILLFEATKREVWDKASQDTSGLKQFYSKNKNNYMWRERAELYTYTVHSNDEKTVNKVHKYASKNNHENILEKFNQEEQLITFSRNKYEVGNKQISNIKFKKNAISELEKDENNGTSSFSKISEIISKSSKNLSEAKGYVIADYQEYLEKNWVESLENEFEIELNEKVFKQLIKK